jgi:hypothetical protein
MPLKRQLVMHARLQGGALYSYNILDGDEVIGSMSARIDKKKRTETRTYFLDDIEFTTVAEFMAAYERRKLAASRDAEWDSAAPKQRQDQPNG